MGKAAATARRRLKSLNHSLTLDCVMGCAVEADARKIMAVLPKRCARFGLRIHPTKTALRAFRKPSAYQASAEGPGTFDFLGLTHSWARSRRGFWVMKRRTARKRARRTRQSLWRWCRTNRHAPLQYQYQTLCQKLRGHFQYVGIRGNMRMLEEVLHYAEKAWRYWLSRRSSKSPIRWAQVQKLLQTYALPVPRIIHSICMAVQGSIVMRQRGATTLVTEEPYAFIAHVRVCGGAGWATAGSTRKPTPTAFARPSLRLLAWLSAGVRLPSSTHEEQ
jgi:hypothetical protein